MTRERVLTLSASIEPESDVLRFEISFQVSVQNHNHVEICHQNRRPLAKILIVTLVPKNSSRLLIDTAHR
jgi:hypothetical protein